MQLSPDEERFVITKKGQKVFVDKKTSEMRDKDACVLSYIGTPTAGARLARLCGIRCKTLIMELFGGAMTL